MVTETNSMKYYCGATDNLPPLTALSLNSTYSYHGTGFAVNAPPMGTPPTTVSYYLLCLEKVAWPLLSNYFSSYGRQFHHREAKESERRRVFS